MNEFTVYDVHKGHCVNTNQQLMWNMNVRLQNLIDLQIKAMETKPVVETVKPAPKRPARKPATKK